MSRKKRDYVSNVMASLSPVYHNRFFPKENGEMIKPRRINTVARVVSQLHTELMAVEDVGEAIATKDPRTKRSYVETLGRLKIALVDLEEMVNVLHTAVVERVLVQKTRDGSRARLLLNLWNSGKTMEEVATEMGIKKHSAYAWLRKLQANGHDVRTPIKK